MKLYFYISVFMSLLVISVVVSADMQPGLSLQSSGTTVYYVDAVSAGGGDGRESAPFDAIQTALGAARAGDTIIVRDGVYTEQMVTREGGNSNAPVYIKAENKHGAVLMYRGNIWEIKHPHITIDGFVFDGNFSTSNGLLVVRDAAHGFILKNAILRNNQRHIVRIASPQDIVIEHCEIYNALWFENIDGKLQRSGHDAHGISTEGVKNMIIRNTSIHDVSGDCFQAEYGAWDDIVLQNVQLWNRPVPEETALALSRVNGDPLFEELKGKYPGENAIDTKQHAYHERGKLYLENVTAYGWRSDFIRNAAAFNLKQNVDVFVNGVTTYDNEICFRLRGPGSRGGAWVLLQNIVMYDSDKGVRYEDGIENLRIYNATWGDNIGAFFESAGGYGDGFEVNNCLFLASQLPEQASHGRNMAADKTDFINTDEHNYQLSELSGAVDACETIPQVLNDINGTLRPQGDTYDCGAYEYPSVFCDPPQCRPSITILTSDFQNHTITSGNYEKVYGTSSSNDITLESGAKAELVHFPGQNSIQIQAASNQFTVSRSGAVVTVKGADGTVLKIPATADAQTISFSDNRSFTLGIFCDHVMLDDQAIRSTPSAIGAPSAIICNDL